jgi:stage IV sporulation protein FB
MRWSFALGNIAGTTVRIHWTFVIFLTWIVFAAYAANGPAGALSSGLFFVLLFGSVLLHEFGHIFTARRFGVRTPDVVLLPIGGVSQMERIPEKPRQELLIALAGPTVNIIIGGLLVLVLGGLPQQPDMTMTNLGKHLWTHLAFTNFALAIFNLLPAFPMDGGRALRALLASRLGYARGTHAAAITGQVFAVGLGLLGLASGNFILLLIAMFVYFAAGAESGMAQLRAASLGASVADVMITRFETLSADATVENAAQALIHSPQRKFLVTSHDGRVEGLVTRDLIAGALREGHVDAHVGTIMKTDVPTISPRHTADHAIGLMQGGAPAVAVIDEAGKLVGMLTLENVVELMLLSKHHPWRHRPAGEITVPHTHAIAEGTRLA